MTENTEKRHKNSFYENVNKRDGTSCWRLFVDHGFSSGYKHIQYMTVNYSETEFRVYWNILKHLPPAQKYLTSENNNYSQFLADVRKNLIDEGYSEKYFDVIAGSEEQTLCDHYRDSKFLPELTNSGYLNSNFFTPTFSSITGKSHVLKENVDRFFSDLVYQSTNTSEKNKEIDEKIVYFTSDLDEDKKLMFCSYLNRRFPNSSVRIQSTFDTLIDRKIVNEDFQKKTLSDEAEIIISLSLGLGYDEQSKKLRNDQKEIRLEGQREKSKSFNEGIFVGILISLALFLVSYLGVFN